MIWTVEAKAEVTLDRHLTVTVPSHVTPGTHDVVLVIDDRRPERASERSEALPVLHVGKWQDDTTLRREEIYGTDGR